MSGCSGMQSAPSAWIVNNGHREIPNTRQRDPPYIWGQGTDGPCNRGAAVPRRRVESARDCSVGWRSSKVMCLLGVIVFLGAMSRAVFAFKGLSGIPRTLSSSAFMELARAPVARALISSAAGIAAAPTKHVLLPIANGTEEIEAVTIIDTLVRGGIKVTVATVHKDSLQVICSRGVKLIVDCHIEACSEQKYDMIVLPGGMPGAEHLRDCADLKALLLQQHDAGRLIGAICAAPAVVLKTHGLVPGAATCYPVPKFTSQIDFVDNRTIRKGGVVTSQGPGTAMEFALSLVSILAGVEKGAAVAKEMLCSPVGGFKAHPGGWEIWS